MLVDRMDDRRGMLPRWLTTPQDYHPPAGSDRYVRASMLSLARVLGQFRLDVGVPSRFSPCAPVKLLLGLGLILLVSLSRNYAFVLMALAFVMVRVALLPSAALERVASVSLGAAAFSFLLMLPAAFIGQTHSALLIATKVLVSVACAMTVSLTTPYHVLTASLRSFRVPSVVVMTFDLALKNIVRLGQVATEVLCALRLRSVGRTVGKGRALGGVGGTVLLKSSEAAALTYDAMVCRGFDGDYPRTHTQRAGAADLVWIAGFLLLLALFVHLQGVV